MSKLQYTFKFEARDAQVLKTWASAEGRSFSGLVRYILHEAVLKYLAEHPSLAEKLANVLQPPVVAPVATKTAQSLGAVFDEIAHEAAREAQEARASEAEAQATEPTLDKLAEQQRVIRKAPKELADPERMPRRDQEKS